MKHIFPPADCPADRPAQSSADAPSADASSDCPPQSSGSLTRFDPAPSLKPRRDGWTAQRQIDFIETLAETACVADACRRVGMSESSAYRLRSRRSGASFRKAWEAALDYAVHRLEAAALSRALHGVARPVFFQGEQVGEYREYDERLTMFLLRYRRRQRFGAWLDHLPAPAPAPAPGDEEQEPDDPAIELDGCLDAIEFAAGDADRGSAEDAAADPGDGAPPPPA